MMVERVCAMMAGLVAANRDWNKESLEELWLKMGWCSAGCEFLRLRDPKKVQTAFSANHNSHTAEGIKGGRLRFPLQ